MSRPEHFIGVVGFPRSGTTVLTALLDAHSEVTMYYEPWNASPRKRPDAPENLAAFCRSMEQRFGGASPATRYVGFKETATYDASRDFAARTVDNVSRETSTHVVWIFRDPIHCFLSKLEGARRWWGNPSARFTEDGLAQYLHESGPHLSALRSLTERHAGAIVCYEALASRPSQTLQSLMKWLGLSPEPGQLEYYKAGPQPDRVMGDPNVAEHPAALSAGSIERRAREVDAHRAAIDGVLSREAFRSLREDCAWLAALPDVAGEDARRSP